MEIISEHFADMIIESVTHAGLQTIKTVPLLFAVFMIIELMENHEIKIKQNAYFIGAVTGCIPQCGFAAAASNLWMRGRLSTGMLITIFVSTSDEALLLLMSDAGNIVAIVYILLIKVVLAVTAGYIVDNIMTKRILPPANKDKCSHHHYCTDTHETVINAVVSHTIKLVSVIFIMLISIDIVIHIIGEDRLSSILMTGSVLQPIIAAAVGLIPGCASSVMITQLYIRDLISFSSLMAGLTANAGLGLILAPSVKIAAIMFVIALIAAILTMALPLC